MVPDSTVNLYDNVYSDFASGAEAAVRQETYGEDLGQSSWLTAREWLGFADQLGVDAESEVLEVGSGSGGPAVYLAAARGCRVTGVDINEHGVRNAVALAEARGVAQTRRISSSWTPAGRCRSRRALRRGRVERRDVPHPGPPGGAPRLAPGPAPGRARALHGCDGGHRASCRTRSSRSAARSASISSSRRGVNEGLLEEAGFAVRGVEDVTPNEAEVADAGTTRESGIATRWWRGRARPTSTACSGS